VRAEVGDLGADPERLLDRPRGVDVEQHARAEASSRARGTDDWHRDVVQLDR